MSTDFTNSIHFANYSRHDFTINQHPSGARPAPYSRATPQGLGQAISLALPYASDDGPHRFGVAVTDANGNISKLVNYLVFIPIETTAIPF